MTMTGYYEMDWLGTGITSNNNQSNSYVMRQRQLWADAKLTNGWDFSGGQGWSLAAETTKGLTRGTEILPATIDPQYEAGFVWTRQYSFRVSKDFGNKCLRRHLGRKRRDPQSGRHQPHPSQLSSWHRRKRRRPLQLHRQLLLQHGARLRRQDGRSSRAGATGNSSASAASSVTASIPMPLHLHKRQHTVPGGSLAPECTGAYNDTTVGGGVGGGFRGPLFNKKVTIGLKGLWGKGVGRYGSSTIADVTVRPNGMLAPLHGFSALSTVELNPTKRLNIYLNYGGDYINREYWVTVEPQLRKATASRMFTNAPACPAAIPKWPPPETM